MDYLWRLFIISALIAECFGDNQAVSPATMQITTTPRCSNCPWKTTTRHTTRHSTIHTNHTTVAPTTAHTNHTTEPPTTAHTNHTTEPPTTAHTNHTTEPPTTPHTNHTTEPPTTAHTNLTTTAAPTTHTNHTTAPHTSAHTNHTTAPLTSAHTNHTTAPHTSAHTNHTTQASTTLPSNHTSTPHTNQTTPPHTTPSPKPSPTEYFVNSTSEVCLRIKAVFIVSMNLSTTFQNYTIPPPPITKANGRCSLDTAELMLTFPNGSLALTFKKDKKKSSFYLGVINVTAHRERFSFQASAVLSGMVTPLGRSFTCKEVNLEVSRSVKLALIDVQAQAIELKGGNFGPEEELVYSQWTMFTDTVFFSRYLWTREMNCSSPSHSKTVPIVVGIVLLVLIIAVVVAYVIARKLRHRSAGYQPL